MPNRRQLFIIAGAGAVILLGGAGVWLLLSPWGIPGFPPAPSASPASYAPPAEPPVAATGVPAPGVASRVDRQWLATTSQATGIPGRALAAYAGVALAKAEISPGCGLSWNTLAAIGYVESRNGSYGGAGIADDGTVAPPIFGVPLAGGDTAQVTDTDGGAVDGDTQFDRAVGPMQLIPQTWRNWHVDANADGVEDPHNIDDATMATANYLCRASPDMTAMAGWQAGISAYNSAPSYLLSIAEEANGYRDAAG